MSDALVVKVSSVKPVAIPGGLGTTSCEPFIVAVFNFCRYGGKSGCSLERKVSGLLYSGAKFIYGRPAIVAWEHRILSSLSKPT